MRTAGRLALVVLAGLMLMGGDDDYVRLTLETPAAAPYRVVRYEVSRRGRTTTAVHRRQLPGYPEPLHAMSLMTRAEAEAVWELVRGADGVTLLDPAEAAGAAKAAHVAEEYAGLAWRVELSVDGVPAAFTVRDPDNQPDRRYARLIGGVMDAVEEAAGELHFRNVFIEQGRMGWVTIVSVPAARVTIDGFATKLDTPLYSYELSAGEHEITLESLQGQHRRDYKIRVERSGTTHLRVDIR